MKYAIYLGEDSIKHTSIDKQNSIIDQYIELYINTKEISRYCDREDTYIGLETLIADIKKGDLDILIVCDSQCVSHFDSDIANLKVALQTSNTRYYEVVTKHTELVPHQMPIKSFYGSKKNYILTGTREVDFEELLHQKQKNRNFPLWVLKKTLGLLFCFFKLVIILLYTTVKLAFSLVLLFV